MSVLDPAHQAAEAYKVDFSDRVQLQLGFNYPSIEHIAGVEMQTDAYVFGYNDGYAAGRASTNG